MPTSLYYKIVNSAFNFIFYASIPIVLLLDFWWAPTIVGLPEKWSLYLSISGILIGIITSLYLYKYYRTDIYEISNALMIGIYLFYTICFFGFFMGVPVFNACISAAAGSYYTIRLTKKGYTKGELKSKFKKLLIVNFTTMLFVCIMSAIFAIQSSSTISDISGMLNLKVKITMAHIWGIIFIGGILLLAFQHILAIMAKKITLQIILK